PHSARDADAEGGADPQLAEGFDRADLEGAAHGAPREDETDPARRTEEVERGSAVGRHGRGSIESGAPFEGIERSRRRGDRKEGDRAGEGVVLPAPFEDPPRQLELRDAAAFGVAFEGGAEGGGIEVAPGLAPELVDREGLALDPPFEAPHQLASMEQRVDVPAPAPLLDRLVDLPDVIEVEQLRHQLAIPEE